MAAFGRVRERMIQSGRGDGRVIDFGDHLGTLCLDPDGQMVEVPVDAPYSWDPLFAVESHAA